MRSRESALAAREERARVRREALEQQERSILELRARADAFEKLQKHLLEREEHLSAEMTEFESRLEEARRQCASQQQAVDAAMADLEARCVLHPLHSFVSLCTAGKHNTSGSGAQFQKNSNGTSSHSSRDSFEVL